MGIIGFYVSCKNYIEFAKDIVYFFGAVGAWKLWKNKKYSDTSDAIQANLAFRKKIEPLLKNRK
jgi:hypothetical protein